MNKVTVGPQTLSFPAPVVIIGALVKGKPNFTTVAWCGFFASEPPTLAIGLRPRRYIYDGIKERMAFSVNVPPSTLVAETDYCGLASGAKVDKAKVCGFTVFNGKLKDVPMIEECPVNIECRVSQIVDLGSHSLFVGQIEETHMSESCLTKGRLDFLKLKPFFYCVGPEHRYQGLGEIVGKFMSEGKSIQTRENKAGR